MKTRYEDIKAVLWKAAGTFRGTIDAANYKDFVLAMLFLKYLDDTYKEHVRNLEEKYQGNQIRIERAKKNLPFVLQDDQRFDYLYENRYNAKIGEMILHELTHFLYPYHDRAFYDYLTIHMPDWQERKKQLDYEFVLGV